MGGMAAPAPSPPGGAHAGGGGMPGMRMRYTHMTFFCGRKSEILFVGWPGADGGMYALALAAVFALAFVLEFLGSRRLDALLRPRAARAAVYALRVGAAYLLMLAIMSFNGGVILVAVAGHAAGFLAFKAGRFGDGRAQVEHGRGKEELEPAACA